MRKIFIFILIVIGTGLSVSASADMNKLLQMKAKVDNINKADFNAAIEAAYKCTQAGDFSCADEQHIKAKKYAQGSEDAAELEKSKQYMADIQVAAQRLQQKRVAIQREAQNTAQMGSCTSSSPGGRVISKSESDSYFESHVPKEAQLDLISGTPIRWGQSSGYYGEEKGVHFYNEQSVASHICWCAEKNSGRYDCEAGQLQSLVIPPRTVVELPVSYPVEGISYQGCRSPYVMVNARFVLVDPGHISASSFNGGRYYGFVQGDCVLGQQQAAPNINAKSVEQADKEYREALSRYKPTPSKPHKTTPTTPSAPQKDMSGCQVITEDGGRCSP